MNTIILHSAPLSCSVNELCVDPHKIGLQISTTKQDSVSFIFSASEAEAVADVLSHAVFKLRALKNNKVAA